MRLGEVAYARSGDKGDILNLSLIPADPADFDWIGGEVSAERVAGLYGELLSGPVERFELPGISAFNFVLHGTLGGGVSRNLGIDPHGKSWSSLLLELEIGERPGR